MPPPRNKAAEFVRDISLIGSDSPTFRDDERLFHVATLSISGQETMHLTVAGRANSNAYYYLPTYPKSDANLLMIYGKAQNPSDSFLFENAVKGEQTGHLLDGKFHVWTNAGAGRWFRGQMRCRGDNQTFRSWKQNESICADDIYGYFVSFPQDETSEEDLEWSALGPLLSELSHIKDVSKLNTLFDIILRRGVVFPNGILADSPALAIVKRSLEIDFSAALELIQKVLRPSRLQPFRFGYFQLSVAGALLSRLSTHQAPEGLAPVIWCEIAYLRDQGLNEFEDRSMVFALLAAYLALVIIAEDPSEESLKRIDSEIQISLHVTENERERILVLRFLGDSLNKAVTQKNLSEHMAAILIFLKYIKDSPPLLRPGNWFFKFLVDSFDSVRNLLTT